MQNEDRVGAGGVCSVALPLHLLLLFAQLDSRCHMVPHFAFENLRYSLIILVFMQNPVMEAKDGRLLGGRFTRNWDVRMGTE